MSEFEERVKARLAAGERYVICQECGARLWSEDANGHLSDKAIPCPYKYDRKKAEEMGCEQAFDRYRVHPWL